MSHVVMTAVYAAQMLSHPGLVPAPLSCNICNKTFVTRGFLNVHLISHSTATPHKSHQCDKPYKKMQELRKHKAKKHATGSWAPHERVGRPRVL